MTMIYNEPNSCMGNQPLWKKFWIALSLFRNPWVLFLDKFGLLKQPLYQIKSGLQLQTRGKTTDVNDAVVVLGGYEYPEKLLGLEGLTNPNVLDVGGHIGCFSLYVKNLYPNARVTILEPASENLKLLKQNLELNRISDVNIVDKALFPQTGHFYLNWDGRPMDAGQVERNKPENSKKYIEIDSISFEDLLSKYELGTIDLLKLDIEGSEYGVIESSLENFGAKVRRIIMEYHTDHRPDGRNEIVDMLTKHSAFELVYESKNILGFQNTKFEQRTQA